MALTNQPVFAQTPKSNVAAMSTANTAADGTGTITTLVTAGADGALVTQIHAYARATVVAGAVRLFVSYDGGTTWSFILATAVTAFTLSNTTAQTALTIVDRNNPDAAIRLPANARLGVTISIANNLNVYAEWIDF